MKDSRMFGFLLFTLLFFNLILAVITTVINVNAITDYGDCNCVVFRLDDIQDEWLAEAQIAIMDLFLEKNQSLSLGLIMNEIGNDSRVMTKISEGLDRGLFELSIHGWNHTDYSLLDLRTQHNTIKMANQKLQNIFGNTSDVFIPPFNNFDQNTLSSLQNNNYSVISASSKYYDNESAFLNPYELGKELDVRHLPITTAFKVFVNDVWVKNPVPKILADIDMGIENYGYASVMMHPQDVASTVNGSITSEINPRELDDLETLIDSVKSKSLKITTYSSVAGLPPKIYNEFQPIKKIKPVILTFDDGWLSQYTTGKPILDQFGFKTTFFIVCDYVGGGDQMSWNQINSLYHEGHDIQSHGMSHANLSRLPASQLEFEVGESKKCLAERGINSTVFATPFNSAENNKTVIDVVSKYYEMAKNGNSESMFLQCDGWKKESSQSDCRTYFDNGTLTFANRYSIKAWNHNFYDKFFNFDSEKILGKFIDVVNSAFIPYENSDIPNVVEIPIIQYHRIDNEKSDTSTAPALFLKEMNYLHDNGFSVITMSDLGYNFTTEKLYIKNLQLNFTVS